MNKCIEDVVPENVVQVVTDNASNNMAAASLLKVVRPKKPAMPWLYGELKQAKDDIKVALKNIESNYKPILDIIDSKAKGRLDSPLHLAAYLLNPYYFYKDDTIQNDACVMEGFVTFIERLYPTPTFKCNLS